MIRFFVLSFLSASLAGAAKPTQNVWKKLEAQAFNRALSVDERWRSLMKVTKAPKPESRKILERAHRDSEWLMRNAALVAMRRVDRQLALKWAEARLFDRAMMVRMAAIGVVRDLEARSSAPLLWRSLRHPNNFHRGVGLPSRRSAVRTLMKLSRDKAKWRGLLKDSDKKIRLMAATQLTSLK